MADGKFYEVMDAIKTFLTAQLAAPIINRIEIYEGAYDEEGVMRLVTNSGVVHLAFLGANNTEELPGGPAIMYASYSLYIASVGNDRVRTALNRLEAMANCLISAGHNNPGLNVTYTLPIIIGSMENLYNKEAGKKGVAIFGLSFAVPILLGEQVFASDELGFPDPTDWYLDDGQNEERLLNGDDE